MAENNTEAKEKTIHDGVSPIYVPEGDEEKAFQTLWEYLIPPRGKAQTAQGEIIRIAGRVQHEFLDNGCIRLFFFKKFDIFYFTFSFAKYVNQRLDFPCHYSISIVSTSGIAPYLPIR